MAVIDIYTECNDCGKCDESEGSIQDIDHLIELIVNFEKYS